MGLPGAVVIDWLVVYHTESDVPIQPGLHLVGPVYGDGGGGVHGYWLGILVHEQPHGWAVLNKGGGAAFRIC